MREHWCSSQAACSTRSQKKMIPAFNAGFSLYKKDPANAGSFSVFISNFYT